MNSTTIDPTTDAPSGECLFGVNLPWLFGSYGHDMAPNELHPEWGTRFDVMSSYRPLIESRDLGFSAVRIWLCEKGEGIVTRDGRIDSVHESLLSAVTVLQECARLTGLKVYWTLLDANSWAREGDRLTGSVLSDPEQSRRFIQRVALPLARALDPKITLALEVINEPEALTRECVPEGHESIPWTDIGSFVRAAGDGIRSAVPGTLVTAGMLPAYLSRFLPTDPRVDALDLHAYHATGGLASREILARDARDERLLDTSLGLIAGECGLPDDTPEDQLFHMQNYLYNAQTLGYSAAFLWRLEKMLVDPAEPARPITALGQRIRGLLRQR